MFRGHSPNYLALFVYLLTTKKTSIGYGESIKKGRHMKFKMSLPTFNREVLDNSILSTHGRCPRLAAYEYRYNRSGRGLFVARTFGDHYHKYRELLETAFVNMKEDFTPEWAETKAHPLALTSTLNVYNGGYEDPPVEHRKVYLDRARLVTTCEQGLKLFINEKTHRHYQVIEHEVAFDLELPSERRFGGRLDQLIEWNGKLWIRDFKTTGLNYRDQQSRYDMSHQFTGYVWGASRLTNRPIEGVMIERIYNTKNNGPEHKTFLTYRSAFDVEKWLDWVEEEYDFWQHHVDHNKWPMRTTSCNDFAGCYFRDGCFKDSLDATQTWLEDNTAESHWDFMNPDEEVGETMG